MKESDSARCWCSVCAVGIRKGAVGLLHLYEPDVQERCVSMGLTTKERIKHNQMLFKVVCLPIYIAYILVCVYVINGARGFAAGLWQMLVMLFVLNLIDRFFIDEYWVGHTKAWTIPGTEDLKPYITCGGQAQRSGCSARSAWPSSRWCWRESWR